MPMSNTAPTKDWVGSRIRAAREKAGLSQQRLADALSEAGFQASQSKIHKIEKNKQGISLEEALVIAPLLNTDLPNLLGSIPRGSSPQIEELERRARIIRDLTEENARLRYRIERARRALGDLSGEGA